jgi:hypothetical protein
MQRTGRGATVALCTYVMHNVTLGPTKPRDPRPPSPSPIQFASAPTATQRPRGAPRTSETLYSGMFPCLRRGPGSRFVCSVSSAVITFGRVSCGTITSST